MFIGCLQLSARIIAAGLVCIWVTYDCDQQRQVFRETNGKERVWRRIPSKVCGSSPNHIASQQQWNQHLAINSIEC